MFRFLHAADLHLDSPLRELESYEGAPVNAVRQAARRALEKLVGLAIEESVRFVLIAGDIYDGDWPDVNTGLFFVQQMSRLRERGIAVYVISGNHDAANKMTRSLPYPDNVFAFPTDKPATKRLDALGVAIHGQGYANAKEQTNLAIGYPAPVPGCLNIGLLHTCLDGREGHERYAPCQLAELIAHGYDYWALGHIHQRESVNGDARPRVEFPGNIQGRHIREAGAKGCLLVHVDDDRRVTTEFRALDVLRWCRATVDCSGVENREGAAQCVAGIFDDLLADGDGRPLAVRVELVGSCAAHDRLLAEEDALRDDIRALALGRGDEKIWIEKVLVQTRRLQTEGAEPILAEDAISELAAVIEELRGQPSLLQAFLDADEITHLHTKLPAELKQPDAAARLTDTAWAASLLDRVQAILTQAALGKER